MKRKHVILLVLTCIIFIIVPAYKLGEYVWASKLVYAVEDEDLAKVERISKGNVIFDINCPAGTPVYFRYCSEWYPRTALSVACSEKNYDIVSFLIENGADVNKKGKIDRSSLCQAIYAFPEYPDSIRIIELLCEKGADIDFHDDYTEYALLEVAGQAIYGDDENDYGIADERSGYTNKDILNLYKYLLELANNKKPISEQKIVSYHEGWSALHYAASSNNLELIRYCVEEQHLDPSLEDANGRTAYDIAMNEGNKEVAEYLQGLTSR